MMGKADGIRVAALYVDVMNGKMEKEQVGGLNGFNSVQRMETFKLEWPSYCFRLMTV